MRRIEILSKKPGYYWHPTIHRENIVFVSEDDLWSVPLGGGLARRLTNGPGRATTPCLSPDGHHLAYVGTEEGNSEVYVMDALGGASTRLTWLGRLCRVVGWIDKRTIVFTSTAGQPFVSSGLYCVNIEGGAPEAMNLGPATFYSVGPKGAAVLTRFQDDPARWKRYKGGRAGLFWIDRKASGDFRRLLPTLPGNRVRASWLKRRIVFLSDHEGVGNLYSCRPSGTDLKKLTNHTDWYARHPRTDGRRVVYHAGADLWVYDPNTQKSDRVDVDLRSSKGGLKRKWVNSGRYLQSYDLSPKSDALTSVVRGKLFSMGLWDGGVTQHGDQHGVRTRLARHLSDGGRAVAVTEEGDSEALALISLEGSRGTRLYRDEAMGRAVDLLPSPDGKLVALANNRQELVVIDLDTGVFTKADTSRFGRIGGFDWSPDSRWLVYSCPAQYHSANIKLFDAQNGSIHDVTRPGFIDLRPSFDPKGRHIYFVSHREFNPVYDEMQFDLAFPRSMLLCLVLLRADLPNPFVPGPRAMNEKEKDTKDKTAADRPCEIELEGISDRVLAFPLPEGRYGNIRSTGKHVYYTSLKIEGSKGRTWRKHEPAAKATLRVYDLTERESRDIAYKVTSFKLGSDNKTLIYRSGRRLRVVPADGSNNKFGKGERAGPKSGWVDLNRIKAAIDPSSEWRQMATEAWRLMGEQFWRADMGGLDWKAIGDRHLGLVKRVTARSELSDLVWELQGELGTSHAYERGGDHPVSPSRYRGFLGATFCHDAESGGARVERIIAGDNWDLKDGSPLGRPGTGVAVGDVILKIDGRQIPARGGVGRLLVNKANTLVRLTVKPCSGGALREVTVKTLRTEVPALYREWVNQNRAAVRAATDGRGGYLHIPNMGPTGYAEFHRGFLTELRCEALVVDVRYNGGGNVSQLLLEKLARKQIGHSQPRWSEPQPYPRDSHTGPLVCLTNEYAASDGDIFSHNFKSMGLGPLVGKRTWGGTIGIWPRHHLVDGGITTQPEFPNWYEGVGFGLENHGAEVDVEVENTPQDHKEGVDRQLAKAIELVKAALES